MKFAVVEYTSKSGGIWHHTADRPNYLADPDKEIDPTSFGCYVSAFEGEHIPLKGMITGSATPVNPLLSFGRRLFRKFVGRWPQGYDLSYFSQFDIVMVVHQISDGHEMTSFARRLSALNPRPFMIGVHTQPFGILQQYWEHNSAWLADFKQFMDSCDVFLTMVQSTVPAWKQLTSSPVVYIAQPYPADYAKKYWQDITAKKPILFVSGVTDRPNIAMGQMVARRLRLKFPQYSIHVTDTPGHTQDLSNLTAIPFTVQPFLPWVEQLQYLSQVKLVINTDFTQTRGRVQTDCAAVGTVSIGADSDGQVDLFPDFPATRETSIDQLVGQGELLLANDALYTQTATKARTLLDQYRYDRARQRLSELPTIYSKKQS